MTDFLRMAAGLVVMAALPVVAPQVMAQDKPDDEISGQSPSDNGEVAGEAGPRYLLERTDDGFVRLDRDTGTMSYCTLEAGRLACRVAADERDAYEAEIARLQALIEGLEAGGAGAERTGKPQKKGDRLPRPPIEDDEERQFEKAMDYAERALRRFFDVIRELGADLEREKTPR